MNQISNRTLTILLVASIVVSIGATMISFHRINRLIPSSTGMVTTGIVNVSIAQTASVNVVDTQIQFGSCAPTAGYGCNVSSNSTTADCSCEGGTWPDNITVQNDGNVDLNVTVKTTDLANTFIGGTGSQFWFSVRNASTRPGCQNATNYNSDVWDPGVYYQRDWLSFGGSNVEYTGCVNLSYADSADQISVFTRLFIPADAPVSGTNQSATLTFTANALT